MSSTKPIVRSWTTSPDVPTSSAWWEEKRIGRKANIQYPQGSPLNEDKVISSESTTRNFAYDPTSTYCFASFVHPIRLPMTSDKPELAQSLRLLCQCVTRCKHDSSWRTTMSRKSLRNPFSPLPSTLPFPISYACNIVGLLRKTDTCIR